MASTPNLSFYTYISKAFDFEEKNVNKFLITDLGFIPYEITGTKLGDILILLKKIDVHRKHILNLGPHDTTTPVFAGELKTAINIIDSLKTELDSLGAECSKVKALFD